MACAGWVVWVGAEGLAVGFAGGCADGAAGAGTAGAGVARADGCAE